MDGVDEQQILAKIRTLLALERNFLAEERTSLAEFRTGLALIVIGPTAITINAYVFSIFTEGQSILFDFLNFAFFSALTVVGIWITFRSQGKLKRIKGKKDIIKKRIIEISKSSKEIFDLLCDCADEPV